MEKDTTFIETVWDFYHQHPRDMPWRDNTKPYWILVSEIMLQQTQAERVIPKFEQFINRFPTPKALASASLGDVLKEWVGLGYNRRAKFLHQSAQRIVDEYAGVVPGSQQELMTLPGVGKNTAGAILAYAYNQPVVYIETNIRAVFIHHFFPDDEAVEDSELLPLIEAHLDRENPREWYWALMDYGTHLKKVASNPSRRSKSHVKQSRFEGSDRQIRGAVIRELSEQPLSPKELTQRISDERAEKIISQLILEGMVVRDGTEVRLA